MMQVQFLNANVINLLSRDYQKVLRSLKRPGALRKPLERSVREVLMPSIEENFLAGGRPKAWPPLEPSTIATRNKTKVPGQKATSEAIAAFNKMSAGATPLMRTHKLFNAAKAFARWTIRNNEATYGNLPSRAWYGVVHDQPITFEPQRQFAVIQVPKDADAITEIFGDWAEEIMRRHIRHRYI